MSLSADYSLSSKASLKEQGASDKEQHRPVQGEERGCPSRSMADGGGAWKTFGNAPSFPTATAGTAALRGLRSERPVPPDVFAGIRRRAMLDGCKWDPQVGDDGTLMPFPLVMKAGLWNELADKAEQLWAEALAAEAEIIRRPELLEQLGLPRKLRNLLASDAPATPSAGRVMRFDFHPTDEGWRISEANSDVPGGFTEASFFSSMMAEQFVDLRLAGCPTEALIGALASAVGPSGVVGLLSAPGYMEDSQVVAFLADRLREHGCVACLVKPEQIQWRQGVAHLETRWHRGQLDGLVRFYQAEWLARLPEQAGWKYLFKQGRTQVTNPGAAIITESKRFPLVWEKLSTPLPTWRRLLPETKDPRDAPWNRDDSWLLKTAYCNTGDTVSVRELLPPIEWRRVQIAARLRPGRWVAQRRFESPPICTPIGERHVCVGIYVVNGSAAGAYARLSEKPVIDFSAADVALLIEDDE